MSTIVKLVADAYPYGCKGDVHRLDDAQLKGLKALQRKRGKTLYEEVKASAPSPVVATDEADETSDDTGKSKAGSGKSK